MKILVFSDSHGKTALMHKIIQKEKPDVILHLGDCYDDMIELKDCYNQQVYGVKGNVDYYCDGPTEKIIELNGKKIFLTHGHHYRVKSGMMGIQLKAKSIDVDFILFGHTHHALIEEDKQIYLNPGSISRPYNADPSYALIYLKDEIKCEIVYVK